MLIGLAGQINRGRFHGAVGDFVDPAIGAVDFLVVVTLPGVGPVADIDAAIGAIGEVNAAEPGIVGEHKIAAMAAHVAGAFALEDVVVHPAAVQIAHEDGVAIEIGPVVAQIDHGADVGVAAAGEIVRFPAAAVVQSPPAQ